MKSFLSGVSETGSSWCLEGNDTVQPVPSKKTKSDPCSVLLLFSMSMLPRGETVDAVLNRQEKKDIMSTKKEMVPPF